jgi:hypothetical protein
MLGRYYKAIGSSIVIAASLFSSGAHAQRLAFFGGVGYASYTHPQLKEYQRAQAANGDLGSRIVDSFSPYYTYMVGGNIMLRKFVYGAELSHGSSGGRVAYKDYSGELIQDLTVVYNSYGASVSFVMLNREDLEVLAGMKLSLIRSKLTVDNSITLTAQAPVTENENFYGYNIGATPHVTLRKFFGSFMLTASAGYELQNSDYPKTKGGLFLDNGSGKEVHLQGNGFRLNLGAGFRLGGGGATE